MPAATDVAFIPQVQPFNVGFRLKGAFHDNPGGGGSDAFLSYTVVVNTPASRIFDAELSGNPSVVPPGATGSISVTEAFLPTFPNLPLSISAVEGGGAEPPAVNSGCMGEMRARGCRREGAPLSCPG